MVENEVPSPNKLCLPSEYQSFRLTLKFYTYYSYVSVSKSDIMLAMPITKSSHLEAN